MKRLDRRDREKQHVLMASESLKDHVVLPGSVDGRWQIGKPNGSSVFRAEIIVTFCNSLIIHGDVDLVCFRSYHGPGGPLAVLGWVAGGSSDYMTQKASMGTGSSVAREYDAEVALDDVLDHIEQGQENPEDHPANWLEVWKEVEVRIRRGDPEMYIQQAIYDGLGDAELVGVGDCTSSRVLWGWLLVKKLHSLMGGDDQ